MEPWKLQPAKDLGDSPGKRLKSLRRESGLVSTAGHLLWWSFIRLYLRVWHRLEIIGAENIPARPPFILIGNHTSHLDAMVLASPLPWRLRDRIFPIAAGDVFFETPLVSAFAAFMLNALPMWRKKVGPHDLHVLRERLIEEPCAYILFPEGGRSRDGSLMPFKPGLGMLIAGTEAPIIPCHLHGCFEALQPDQRLPRPRKITLTIGSPISYPTATNDRKGWIAIATDLQARVQNLHGHRKA